VKKARWWWLDGSSAASGSPAERPGPELMVAGGQPMAA